MLLQNHRVILLPRYYSIPTYFVFSTFFINGIELDIYEKLSSHPYLYVYMCLYIYSVHSTDSNLSFDEEDSNAGDADESSQPDDSITSSEGENDEDYGYEISL